MKGKSVEASRNPSTKRKKNPQGETLSPILPIINVPFLERDSGVLGKVDVQASGSIPSEPKQKAVAKKNSTLPSKRRKMPILNEEEVDNTLVGSPKMQKVEIIFPTNFSKGEGGDSDSESNSLSPKLGSLFL